MIKIVSKAESTLAMAPTISAEERPRPGSKMDTVAACWERDARSGIGDRASARGASSFKNSVASSCSVDSVLHTVVGSCMVSCIMFLLRMSSAYFVLCLASPSPHSNSLDRYVGSVQPNGYWLHLTPFGAKHCVDGASCWQKPSMPPVFTIVAMLSTCRERKRVRWQEADRLQ